MKTALYWIQFMFSGQPMLSCSPCWPVWSMQWTTYISVSRMYEYTTWPVRVRLLNPLGKSSMNMASSLLKGRWRLRSSFSFFSLQLTIWLRNMWFWKEVMLRSCTLRPRATRQSASKLQEKEAGTGSVYLTRVKLSRHWVSGQTISQRKWKLRFQSMEREVMEAMTLMSLWDQQQDFERLRSIIRERVADCRRSPSETWMVPARRGTTQYGETHRRREIKMVRVRRFEYIGYIIQIREWEIQTYKEKGKEGIN